ncbi:hypothetical protein NC796_15000 [Aliifodinibius sp. S!AR15-10]|uniref:hypothetical protein n=1 Tax=Aliifodinibius sp. S!AR15-10 TaxID=2950437 RepID=UPI0028646603|nr:hypothetical protein [Aliifodinibius sp. S!AR15-10]MDR8392460.1 hypothetical protein [Aliifodinibius sp. S!AR15-10]
MSERATIYGEPIPDSELTFDARKGDIFKVEEGKKEWVQIMMFSDSKRYIRSSDVDFTTEQPVAPSDPEMLNKFCAKVKTAKRKATNEAALKYAENIRRQRIFERLLFDRYILEAFRKFDIPATKPSKLVECIDDSPIYERRIKN